MLIKHALIHDAIHEEPYLGDILVKDGKIAKIGKRISAPEETEVIEAKGLFAYPGLVQAHCHVGLDDFGGPGGAQHDYNESTSPCTPEVRGLDSYYSFDKGVSDARKGGTTTICTGPGSSNVLGGTFLIIKTYGKCVEETVMVPDAAMKCAFGENVKKNGVKTRMMIAAKLREMLFKTKEYAAAKDAAKDDPKKMPKFDMKLEAMIPVIRGEMPLKAHCHRTDDICTAIRIAKEFGVKLTLEHCTEGYMIPEIVAASGYPVAVGPNLTNSGKKENMYKEWANAKILDEAGVPVSIITDAPVTPEQYYTLCAAECVKAGMNPFRALQAITINPARHIGVEDRVGSLEVGKDADILLTTGDILEIATVMKKVIIDGKVMEEN